MGNVGQIIIWIIMVCAFIGAISSIVNEESELGNEFINGIQSISVIFLSVGGVMASIPILVQLITIIISPIYNMLGADPALSATTFVAVDMGGYQLADALSQTRESWIMAMITGYMAGATLVFTIPVALKIMDKQDYKYLAYGILSGFMTIPIGVLIPSILMLIFEPSVRDIVSTTAEISYQLDFNVILIIRNLVPLLIICLIIVVGLLKAPAIMIKAFEKFGIWFNAVMRIVFVICVIEYFTQFFSSVFDWFGVSWLFEPLIADNDNVNRALENAGYIGIILCGTFPMMYIIKKHFMKPLSKIATKFDISEELLVGIVGCCANVLASLSMVKSLNEKDKVSLLAFAVCGSFMLGDHLAFTSNYQPSLIVYILIGKLTAAIIALVISRVVIYPLILKNDQI